jgi:hypothetical protein
VRALRARNTITLHDYPVRVKRANLKSPKIKALLSNAFIFGL